MNLDQAFVLLLASASAVAGFAPTGRSPAFSVTTNRPSSCSVAFVSKARVVSALFSEVEEATETSVEATTSEEQQEPEFDTSIYVGNLSFGECDSMTFCRRKSIEI